MLSAQLHTLVCQLVDSVHTTGPYMTRQTGPQHTCQYALLAHTCPDRLAHNTPASTHYWPTHVQTDWPTTHLPVRTTGPYMSRQTGPQHTCQYALLAHTCPDRLAHNTPASTHYWPIHVQTDWPTTHLPVYTTGPYMSRQTGPQHTCQYALLAHTCPDRLAHNTPASTHYWPIHVQTDWPTTHMPVNTTGPHMSRQTGPQHTCQ